MDRTHRTGTGGPTRDKAREWNELAAQLANLRSINRLAARAVALGFAPATGDQLEYLKVTSYPQDIHLKPPPRAAVAPPPPSTAQALLTWFTQTAGTVGATLSTQLARLTSKAGG